MHTADDAAARGTTLRQSARTRRVVLSSTWPMRTSSRPQAGSLSSIRPPKYESERTIYLPDELVTILAEHVRLHTPNGDPTRWLFDEGGKPWHDNLVDYRWRSTRTDAGCPASCTSCGTTSPAG